MNLPSPKVTGAEKRRLVYPYYAGFSEQFVDAMLDRMNVGSHSVVVDPWLGSGTTTYRAALRGAHTFGFDLNRVMIAAADARSAKKLDVERARLAWRTARSLGGRFSDAPTNLQARAIASHVERTASRRGIPLTRSARALISCALAESVRILDRPNRASNPTWFKGRPSDIPVPFKDVRDVADQAFDRISSLFPPTYKYPTRRPAHLHGDFRFHRLNPGSVDCILTSPPYLTRIDYVKATLPELRFLGANSEQDVDDLRRRMMGSPLVGGSKIRPLAMWGSTANDFLTKAQQHSSKASSTYYRSFYLKYFNDLYLSLCMGSYILKRRGLYGIVVQDSHYKEIYIDLARVVTEMATGMGFAVADQKDFYFGQSMVNVNPRAVSRDKGVTESVILLQKAT